ncbi:C39 family peptidase [Flavonifractor sp. An306]|uniref:C39 family peptidase n=1 Tax=Flavonifractor sp. An306 TaxID=1965629 RepID=UPI000B3A07B2|nr:C39 family peptidase [Flavonifractor sp. An306]OUO37945.1 hypothetical protein B5F88_12065 [Flavonifractor sp. An306]
MKKYVINNVIAEQNWCVPATLEMVLKHFGFMDITQYDIAKQLIIVSDQECIDHKKWGAQIKTNTLNNFFSKNHIPLIEEYIPISHFIDDFFMIDKLEELLAKGITVVCGFNYTYLYSSREDTFQHVSIITEVVKGGREVTLLDPGPKDAGYKTVRAEDLFLAIQAAGDGLWCIKPKAEY